MCPLFPASSAKAPATREGKARKGRREPDLLSFRIRLFETNFLGPQGCLNKKHTCGEPTAGVAHTFPGGIQGPGRGVTAHQRAPPEKATGPARLAHPGFGLEHPGYGPKTGKSLNFTYHHRPCRHMAQSASGYGKYGTKQDCIEGALEELGTMIKHYNLICMKKLGNK